jgi:hypothetical protein
MKKVLTIVIICLFVFCIAKPVDGGQSFTKNVKVNNDTESADQRSPSITVDNSGIIYVVWNDRRGNTSYEDIYFAKSTDGGQTFSKNVKINDGAGDRAGYRPIIKVDSKGTIYVVWTDFRNGWDNPDIYFVNSTDGGLTFGTNFRVNDGKGATWESWPSMDIDNNDNIYIAWTDRRNGSNDYDIYFTKSTDSGLSFEPNVKVNEDIGGVRQTCPSLAVDDGSNVHIVWRDFRNGGLNDDIYYARSIDSGKTFETSMRVNDDNGTEAQWQPSIAVDDESNVYVVWGDFRESGKENVYFARSTDNGLSFDANIKVNDGESQLTVAAGFPSIAANKKDNICVVWVDGRNISTIYDIYFARSMNGGLSFNESIMVNDDIEGACQGGPSIAVDSFGIPYIVWVDNRNGDMDIYFARGIILQPDLSVEEKDIEIDPTSPIQNDAQITINATIHNIGQVNASNVIVRFYDGDPSLNKQIGTDQTICFIERDGGIGYAEVGWVATPVGIHNIYVVVDPKNTIAESNETNNIASKALEVIDNLPPTLYIKAFGDDVILNWTQSGTTGLSHYLLYRSTSQTEFNFNCVWVNTSSDHEFGEPGPIPLRTMWNDTNAAFPSNISNYRGEYYYVIRAYNNLGQVSSTSRTVGKWTKTFPKGVSTFSLPLEPLENITIDYYLNDMSAKYIKWMNQTTHTWMKHGNGGVNDTQMRMGEGYEVKFTNQTNYTFTGLPGAMISYDDNTGFLGFDPATEGKNLKVSVEPNGNVTLTWQEPASMGVGDWYEVYYSNTRDGFFRTFNVSYFLICPPVYFGNNTTTHTGALANNPGTRLYYMVIPFNASGVRGAGTYSIGVWTEEYLQGYDTFGIPLKLETNQTADWYCDNIHDTVGINYYIYSEQRWCWHSTRMPAEAYDPVLVMTEGYQISTSSATKFTFIGS